ncbi:Sigma70, region containing protein [Candidatus Hepatoplasma crinochetorum Av]|uniref:Sigma70, region containing protein n=1 Tax=Candidatus Hepatoplasma crinochetorum Av TaxID=1427984 RepID=W8GME0_9MOLU|nr:hypothetical protein [Candidatus Hepatoplasma crinochetorum]AHK22191.1 Sigma70, region containing protein [Candidatus Hepatoplasma crinochetorum Av]
MKDVFYYKKNGLSFLFAKKINENWDKNKKILYLHLNYNLSFNSIAQEFGLTKERIRQILLEFVSAFSKDEKIKFFNNFYVKRKKFRYISKLFNQELRLYKEKLENELEEIIYRYEYNDNYFKVVDKKEILKTNLKYFLKLNNYFSLKLSEFNNKFIFLSWKRFEFKDFITRKDKVDIIAKAYFKPYVKYKIDEIISIYKIYFPKLTKRAIEGMLFNYNEIFSLSAGKYMISYYKDKKEYLYFTKIADLIYNQINDYFNNNNNIICDISKFEKDYNFKYPFLNEHHYYFFAKKYSEKFNQKFDSFRSPIIFKKEQKENILGKDIQLLFKKQIFSLLKEEDLYEKWIERDQFLKIINQKYGIKDYYFLQKMHLFNVNKISGNKNQKGKIMFLKDS